VDGGELLAAARLLARLADELTAASERPLATEPDEMPRGPEVCVAMLGPFEVRVCDRRISRWGAQKNRTLLQYLVLHPDRPVHREVLMELLWPGYGYTSARNNLNVCVYGLRQALQEAWRDSRYVLYRDGAYLLDPDLSWQVDRTRFLSLIAAAREAARAGRTGPAVRLNQDAARLYRGPLFEDDPNCDWFAAARRNLHELYLRALEDLADLHLDARDVGSASDIARHVLDLDACRESAHRLLMRCYSQQQQRGLIARQFQLCIAALRNEFSLSPADETVRLFRAPTATDARS
jgi:DNA-binding SARP family transcriptional activator